MAKKIKIKTKKPKHSEGSVPFDMALQYYNSGNLQQAEMLCRHILGHKSDNDAAWHLLGLIAGRLGRHEESISCINKAIRINPSVYSYYSNLGLALRFKGCLDEAIENFQKAVELKPDFAGAFNNLGIAFAERDMTDDALKNFKKALELSPNFFEAIKNIGDTYKSRGMIDEAIESYKKLLKVKPDFAEAYFNIGVLLADKGMVNEAIENYRTVLMLKPDLAEAYNNLGFALADKGMLDEAMENYKKALAIKPDLAEAYNNLGFALANKDMLNEAMENYKKALMLKPDYAEAHWNMGLVLLRRGNFKEGWRKHEWRLLKKDYPSRLIPYPVWDGSPLKGKTVIICAEQGVGDEIMFASCLPDVLSLGGPCVLECDKRLIPLFSRSFPEVTLIPRRKPDEFDESEIPSADMKIAIGSLPLHFRQDLQSFPQQKEYLMPDPDKVRFWQERYRQIGNGLNIGISWRGGKKENIKRIRSINLEKWSGVFAIEGVNFINLQYGDCSQDLLDIQKQLNITIHDWEDSDPLKDLDDFAAKIAALDLVISVDNSTVHMSGALGVPAWVLLPFSCEWRWMENFEDSPWYKNVRLYRQSSFGDWDRALEHIASSLRQYVTTRVMPDIDNRYSYKGQVKVEKGLE